MKKQIFALILAIGMSVVVNAGQTYAQSETFRIEVPFAFNAQNRTLPAGTYVVNPATENRIMWKIQGVDQEPIAFLMAGSLADSKEFGNARLTFRRYGSEHFLVGFNSFSYQVKLPTSSSEKKLRRTVGDLSKYNVDHIETVSVNNQ